MQWSEARRGAVRRGTETVPVRAAERRERRVYKQVKNGAKKNK